MKRGLSLLDQVYKALPKKKGAFDRALILTEKGHVYRALSDIDLARPRAERLKLAMEAFDEAIAILREKENFHYWSLAVSASALVAAELARIEPAEKVRGYLELAIERFETALVFFSGDDAPQDLSYVYFEMGRTLMQLAFGKIGFTLSVEYSFDQRPERSFRACHCLRQFGKRSNAISESGCFTCSGT